MHFELHFEPPELTKTIFSSFVLAVFLTLDKHQQPDRGRRFFFYLPVTRADLF